MGREDRDGAPLAHKLLQPFAFSKDRERPGIEHDRHACSKTRLNCIMIAIPGDEPRSAYPRGDPRGINSRAGNNLRVLRYNHASNPVDPVDPVEVLHHADLAAQRRPNAEQGRPRVFVTARSDSDDPSAVLVVIKVRARDLSLDIALAHGSYCRHAKGIGDTDVDEPHLTRQRLTWSDEMPRLECSERHGEVCVEGHAENLTGVGIDPAR